MRRLKRRIRNATAARIKTPAATPTASAINFGLWIGSGEAFSGAFGVAVSVGDDEYTADDVLEVVACVAVFVAVAAYVTAMAAACDVMVNAELFVPSE